MFLKTKIKVGKLTNLTDARYFAAQGVDWLGFSLQPGDESQVSPALVSAIVEWVEGPKVTGEFGHVPAETILEQVETLGLQAIQIPPYYDQTERSKLAGLEVIQEVIPESIDDLLSLPQDDHPVTVYLLNGIANQLDWSAIQQHSDAKQALIQFCQNNSVLLELNFSATDLDEVLRIIQPTGFQVKGGAEEKVGYKSFDELDDWFEVLQQE